MEKNLLPDDVIVLGDEGEGKSANLFQNILRRFVADHKQWLYAQIDKRNAERIAREAREREEEAARIR